jgi:hypothetical protein
MILGKNLDLRSILTQSSSVGCPCSMHIQSYYILAITSLLLTNFAAISVHVPPINATPPKI